MEFLPTGKQRFANIASGRNRDLPASHPMEHEFE
jgi:hypothetical protein